MAAALAIMTSLAAAPVASAQSLAELASRWVDQDEAPFTWADASGHPTLVAMVYTSCQMSCPLITRELQKIERKLTDAERQGVRVLLVSFDPERDKSPRLKAYAEKQKLDETRWRLLTGTENGARELAVVLGGQFKKLQNGDFSHSNTVTVLDRQGKIVHQQPDLGVGEPETLAAIRKALAP